MNFDLAEIRTIAAELFVVIDIIGSIPIVLDLRKKVGHIHSEKATVVAGLLMIAFLFLGKEILEFIGLTEQTFAIAGSFIIFFFALEMILGISLYRDDHPETASIVPIAFPLIAGATSLTMILNYSSKYHTENIIVAILINLIIVYLVLKSAKKIYDFLGKQGISIVRKVFGVILLAIAIKLFAENGSKLMILIKEKQTEELLKKTEEKTAYNENFIYYFGNSSPCTYRV
ncbi:MarC family protein [Capnocytophaga canimorsus]|uniref:MarC family protein n=1 Tax=Capnocytophaga canimorsus TaxID=28188 RepID=UPI00384C5C23